MEKGFSTPFTTQAAKAAPLSHSLILRKGVENPFSIFHTPPHVSPTQKRLTRILLALGIAGSFVICWLWRDSMRYLNVWRNDKIAVMSFAAYAGIVQMENPPTTLASTGLLREKTHPQFTQNGTLFPKPSLDKTGVRIPYYLILLTCLATLFLTWLLLMNRLARREAMKESRASSRQQ